MENFTIQCTSCQSRIRVRNANMIGQIANCPKCGSMIMIAAPQKITVDSGNATDSVAVTRESLPPPDEGLLGSPPLFETGFRSEGLPLAGPNDPFDGLPAEDEAAFDGLPPGSWMPEPTPPPRSSEPGNAESASDTGSSYQRSSRLVAASQSRQVILVAAIGLCSVLLAAGMLFLFLQWFGKPNATAQDPTAPAPAAPADLAQPNAPAVPAPNLVDALDPVTGQPIANATLNPNVDGPNLTDPLLSGNPAAATATNPPTTPSTINPNNIAAAQPDSLSGTPALPGVNSNTPPATVSSLPPRGMGGLGSSIAPSLEDILAPSTTPNAPTANGANTNGASADGANTIGANAAGSDADGQSTADKLPPGLQNFAALFNSEREPLMADSSVPLSDAPDVSDDADKPVQPVAPTKDLLPAVVDQKLKLQLSGLLIDKRPLSEALTTLSLMSDIPMMADIDALLAAGLSRNPMIEFRSTTPITLGNMLKKIETDAQVTFVPWENKMIYVRGMPAAIESRVAASLPIHDLVTDEPQTQSLVQVIHEILPELANKVQINQGSLTIELTAENRLAWFQAARLLESWRASRGIQNVETSQLVPLTSQLPAWPMEAGGQIAQTKIKQSLSPEPIARSWQRLAAEAKIYCWVDAFALLSSDVSPSEKAMVLSAGRSLGNILNNYTDKFGVVFAVEDSKSLWVTTPTMHRLQPRLYVVPQSDKSAEQWISELESLAPLHPNSGASMLKVLPSPDGKYFFIRACRPLLGSP